MRLAFVSPLPPAATGVADYTADVLRLLAPAHEIEAFHGQDEVETTRLPAGLRIAHAAELPARHAHHPFDLIVHQLGNGPAHGFAYDLVSRLPGLLVLHDLVLFHSRAAVFTDSEPVRAWRAAPASAAARAAAQPALDAWKAELEYSYPGRGERLYAAHMGSVGDLLPYAYPLLRLPVEASRAVLVHSAYAAVVVREEVPGAVVTVVPQPVEPVEGDAGAIASLRARLGFARDDVVVGCFGLLTREKRVDAVAAAVARASAIEPRLRLLLAGPLPDRPGLEQRLSALGLEGRAVLTGRLAHGELGTHIGVADIVAHLRWPTARETSAALLRVLAQGRPSIVSDLQHQADLPADCVWRIDPAREADLELALLALARDPGARLRLGAAAAEHVRRAHAPARVAAGWTAALELARGRAAPAPGAWPAHWPRPEQPQSATGA